VSDRSDFGELLMRAVEACMRRDQPLTVESGWDYGPGPTGKIDGIWVRVGGDYGDRWPYSIEGLLALLAKIDRA
jgi:hypothetical protein